MIDDKLNPRLYEPWQEQLGDKTYGVVRLAIPPFDYRHVTVFCTASREEYDEVKRGLGWEAPAPTSDAFSDSDHLTLGFLAENDCVMAEVILHEVMHMRRNIYEIKGVESSASGTEFDAYFTQFLFAHVCNIVQLLGFKVIIKEPRLCVNPEDGINYL